MEVVGSNPGEGIFAGLMKSLNKQESKWELPLLVGSSVR